MLVTLKRQWLPVVALACAALLQCGYGWWQSRPAALTEAAPERLSCASYAPYHKPGQTPFDATTMISEAQIAEDLELLSHRFNCVRTYSVQQGLAVVPRIAQRYGMKTLLGLWIGRDQLANEQEIVLGIATANRDRDAIRAIIVGNEVLLRRELPPQQLQDYLLRVGSATKLPVTYADVWEFWLKNRELAAAVSFVTIHILPYWEDDPIAIEHAIDHVTQIYARMQQVFPDKPLLIGETGWPSSGRQRGGALPSLVNQARFTREFVAAAGAHDIPYNLVEAFDQPWKRALEGTAGGYWGIYDTEGREKFPLRGPVAENPEWQHGIVSGGVLSLALLLFAMARVPRPRMAGMLALLFAGVAGGGLLASQWRELLTASRNLLEWSVTGGYSVLALIAAWALALALAQVADGAAPPRPATGRALRDWLQSGQSTQRPLELWLGALRLAFLFGAATVCLLLVFDSRYRDFPFALYGVPAIGFALLAFSSYPRQNTAGLEEKFLAALLPVAAVFIAINEGIANQHALAWSGLCVLFAAGVLLPRRAPQHQQAEQHADG